MMVIFCEDTLSIELIEVFRTLTASYKTHSQSSKTVIGLLGWVQESKENNNKKTKTIQQRNR